MIVELEAARVKLHETTQKIIELKEDKIKDISLPVDNTDSTSSSLSQKIEILEKEISLLREENVVLKTAHDRLIAKFTIINFLMFFLKNKIVLFVINIY